MSGMDVDEADVPRRHAIPTRLLGWVSSLLGTYSTELDERASASAASSRDSMTTGVGEYDDDAEEDASFQSDLTLRKISAAAEEEEVRPASPYVAKWVFTAIREKPRDCSARRAPRGRQQQQNVCEALGPDLLGVCVGFLDFRSLVTCQTVSKTWHRILQDPFVWEQFYSTAWRKKWASLPAGYRHALFPHFKDVCRARMDSQFAVSTRARTWVRTNGNVFVHNDSVHRAFMSGCVESIRTESALLPLACGRAVGANICYFEVTLSGCGSIGIASVSSAAERLAYGFGSQSHLGWYPVSYGYHGDDGLIYWNDGTTLAVGGSQRAYGPSWGDTTPLGRRKTKFVTIGCGYCLDTRQLFYTMDGQFVGRVPVLVEPSRAYAAAVSLHQVGDSAEINFGCSAFEFDIEQYIWETVAPKEARTPNCVQAA